MSKNTFTIFPEAFEATAPLSNEQFGILMRAAFRYWGDGTAYSGEDALVALCFGFICSGIDRYKARGEAMSQNARRRWDKMRQADENAADVPRNLPRMQNECDDMQAECDGMQSIHSEMQSDAAAMQSDATAMQSDATAMQSDATAMQSDAPIQSIPDQSNPYPIHSIPDQSNPSQSRSDAGLTASGLSHSAKEAESPAQADSRFAKPTVDQVQAYCASQGLNMDAERFVRYYDAAGWLVRGSPMMNWKAMARSWAQHERTLPRAAPKDDVADYGCDPELMNWEAYHFS